MRVRKMKKIGDTIPAVSLRGSGEFSSVFCCGAANVLVHERRGPKFWG